MPILACLLAAGCVDLGRPLSPDGGMGGAAGGPPLLLPSLGDQLLSHWQFDEGQGNRTEDAIPSGSVATLVSTGWGVGVVGTGALSVAGTGDFATIEFRGDADDFGRGDFAISLWFSTSIEPQTDTYPVLLSNRDPGQSAPLGIQLMLTDANALQFDLNGEMSTDNIAFFGPLNDGLWHHVVAQRIGDEAALYVDGTLRTSHVQAVGSTAHGEPLYIGSLQGAQWSDFDGRIDDLRFYGRPLNSDEIMALAAGGTQP